MKLVQTILLLLLFSSIMAQDARLKFTLDKEEMPIGDQAKLVLVLEHPVSERTSFPEIPDTLTSKIEVVSHAGIDTTYEGNNLEKRILSDTLFITSWDTGYWTIPPFETSVGQELIKSDPGLIHIQDVEVEMPQPNAQGQAEVEIKDIKNIRDADFSIWEWIKVNRMYFFAALLLAALIFVYIKYIHPRLQKQEVSILPVKKEDPAHVQAIQKLNALKEKKLWQNGKVKAYHIELSEIVRQYVEDEMKTAALESTTHEIIRDLNQVGIAEGILDRLSVMLELSDLVKFAKHQPLPNENESSMIAALRFVEDTRPAPETERKEEIEDV